MAQAAILGPASFASAVLKRSSRPKSYAAAALATTMALVARLAVDPSTLRHRRIRSPILYAAAKHAQKFFLAR